MSVCEADCLLSLFVSFLSFVILLIILSVTKEINEDNREKESRQKNACDYLKSRYECALEELCNVYQVLNFF